MEMLDQPDDAKILAFQTKLGDRWDSVLSYEPRQIDEYLKWYHSSVEGVRPAKANLAEQFLTTRFPVAQPNAVSQKEAQAILAEVNKIDLEFETLRVMNAGEWPFQGNSTVSPWDRERVRMLVTHLKHTNVMPLLLSLHSLGEKQFAEAIAVLERFVFRYRIIGRTHISAATALYHEQAKAIRDGEKFSLGALRAALQVLIDKYIPDDLFRAQLAALQYVRGGNLAVRYLLATLDDYREWVDSGAQGTPKCKDKTTSLDLLQTTLEHIYPNSPKAADKNAALDNVKNQIGNLAILGPGQNNKLANKSFAEKKATFAACKLSLTRDVASKPEWTKKDVEARTTKLIDMAMRVFTP
jgi:hypothetical protein